MGPDASPSGRLLYAGLLETLLQGMGTSNGYLIHHGPRIALLAERLGENFQLSPCELGELLVAGVGMVGLVEDAGDRPIPGLSPPQRAQVRQDPEGKARLNRHIPHLESVEPLLDVLGVLIDAKDPYTGGHSRRVGVLAREVAGILGLDHDTQKRVQFGGHLHDLGKLRIPKRILTKNSNLTADEVRLVERHTVDGASLLEGIPALASLAPACRYHHERWDGEGYPEGISGDRIPIMAQILAVTDAYDAMTSQRTYRHALPHHAALGEVAESKGAHFGPEVVDAFLSLPARVFAGLRSQESEKGQPLDPLLDPLLHVPVGRTSQRMAGA